MSEDDEQLARILQEEEYKSVALVKPPKDESRTASKGLAHFLAVNPDIHELFINFDRLFFDGKLGSVEVKWSKKMTLYSSLPFVLFDDALIVSSPDVLGYAVIRDEVGCVQSSFQNLCSSFVPVKILWTRYWYVEL
jgi:hypothetical protein